MRRVQTLGLDGSSGEGWDVAARLWAEARTLKPALVFADADLLIAATAAFHGHDLVTAEVGLVEGLKKLAFPVAVRLVPMQ